MSIEATIQPGERVATGYVPVQDVVLDCRAPMAIGDIERKYELVKRHAPAQLYPCPFGYWSGDRFHLIDGRHTFMAYAMLGFGHVLVAWEKGRRG